VRFLGLRSSHVLRLLREIEILREDLRAAREEIETLRRRLDRLDKPSA